MGSTPTVATSHNERTIMKQVHQTTKRTQETTYKIEWEDILKLIDDDTRPQGDRSYVVRVGDTRYTPKIFPILVYTIQTQHLDNS